MIINGNKVSEVICLYCFNRWISARNIETRLIQLECPLCRNHGYAIETGETDTAERLLRMGEKGNKEQ